MAGRSSLFFPFSLFTSRFPPASSFQPFDNSISVWANHSSSGREASTFDSQEFERDLLEAEKQLHYTSTHLENPDAAPSLAADEGLLFTVFNLLVAVSESRYRNWYRAAFHRPRATLIITWVSWIVAIAVAVVGITFTTRDFLRDFRDPILNIELVPKQSLRLPVLSVCSTQLDIPALPLLHRSREERFQGVPLFTARSLENFENASITFWPNTVGEGLVTPAYRGPSDGRCLQRFRALDARDSEDKTTSLTNERLENNCQYCFQIGRKRPLTLRPEVPERPGNPFNPLAPRQGIRLHLVMLQYRKCLLFDDANVGPDDFWEFLKGKLVKAAPDLQSRGILEFSDAANLTDPDDLDRVIIIRGNSPVARALPFSLDFEGIIMSAKEMACHVYFWSDFFFPQATAEVDVRYKYNTTTLKWDRSGTGPFLRERRTREDYLAFRSLRLEDQSHAMTSRPVEVYMEKPEELSDLGRLNSGSAQGLIGSAVVHRVGDRAERIATIDEFQTAKVFLTREEDLDGRISYRAQKTHADIARVSNFSEHIYVSYFVHFQFDSFVTERLTRSIHPQWARYFADVAGYASLMLGVTAYHLVIAPATALLLGRRLNGEAEGSEDGDLEFDQTGADIDFDKRTRSWSSFRRRVGVRRYFTGVTEPLQQLCRVSPT